MRPRKAHFVSKLRLWYFAFIAYMEIISMSQEVALPHFSAISPWTFHCNVFSNKELRLPKEEKVIFQQYRMNKSFTTHYCLSLHWWSTHLNWLDSVMSVKSLSTGLSANLNVACFCKNNLKPNNLVLQKNKCHTTVFLSKSRKRKPSKLINTFTKTLNSGGSCSVNYY